MFKKEILIGNFIKKNKILSYLEYIHNTFHISYNSLFVYNIEDNNDEYIVTFKIDVNNKSKMTNVKGGTFFHFKRGCIFSINAINRMIENEASDIENKKDYEIDWSKYENTIITLHDDTVNIKKINKIEDKTVFFK